MAGGTFRSLETATQNKKFNRIRNSENPGIFKAKVARGIVGGFACRALIFFQSRSLFRNRLEWI